MTDTDHGRITADGVAYMRSFIGTTRTMRPWHSVVNSDAIWHFAQGVGDDNPLWWDPAYAAASSWGRSVAPPTFLYTAISGGNQPGAEVTGEVDDLLPGVLGLWAGERWHWYGPVVEGTRLSVAAGLHSVEHLAEGPRAPRVIQVERFSIFGDGELLATCDKTIIRVERSPSPEPSPTIEHETSNLTDDERRAIAAAYEGEHAQRRGAVPRRAADVAVGDPLGRLVKGPLTVTNMVGWLIGWGNYMVQTNRMLHLYVTEHPGAALRSETTGIDDSIEAAHWDVELARLSGMPTGYDLGSQRVAWLAHLLTDWCGDDGALVDLDVRIRKPNLLGDVTWIDGEVTGVHHTDEGPLVDCELRAVNQRGEVTTTATASVRLP